MIGKTETPNDSIAEKILVEEYKSCRDLIGRNIEIIEKTEVYAMGSTAAVAVFSLSRNSALLGHASSYIPLVISAVGTIRFFGVDKTIKKINNYLVTVEGKYKDLGWTKFYRESNKIKWLKGSRYLIWTILITLSVIFIHVIYMKKFPQP